MSRRMYPDQHNIQISTVSYPAVRQLIAQGQLIPIDRAPESDNPIKGLTDAELYVLAADAPIEILSDVACVIGGLPVQAKLYALPSPAYHAVVRANPFTQYPGIAELRATLRTSATSALEGLRRAVQQGRQPGQLVAAAQESAQFVSCWMPDQTVVQIKSLPKRAEPDVFLTLAFRAAFTGVFPPRREAAMGLDVGLQPHTVVAREDGQVRHYHLSPLVRLPTRSLSSAERELHEILQYAQGREDSEVVVAYLIGHASHIYAEVLEHRGMSTKYIARSRQLALQDAFYSHLSQYANAAGIPFTRVDAHHSSTTCPDCETRGERDRDIFRCPACGLQRNAHEVGALNVLARGLKGGVHLRTGRWRASGQPRRPARDDFAEWADAYHFPGLGRR
ncbi:zinc ribbon domain-containing protein [Deinococcus radiotolerans]|uniref:Cas12f1-like TNB domain-containing protein n=1 Tax=Deinococcus radiotolerans TaxID=1309407 RepID=A0ABQ2FNF2_9DEIO|nr:zinc ribbon domain-containing protein [Deinococcus radiotolerans]GGL11250.1 hypothetical protein GCM10010844_32400 [Deinococcus radiotolerans]